MDFFAVLGKTYLFYQLTRALLIHCNTPDPMTGLSPSMIIVWEGAAEPSACHPHAVPAQAVVEDQCGHQRESICQETCYNGGETQVWIQGPSTPPCRGYSIQ